MKISKFFNKLQGFLPKALKRSSQKPRDLLLAPLEEQGAWWGTLLVDNQQSRYSKIGNVILCIDNYNQEWQLDIYRENNLTQKKTKTLGTQIVTNEISLIPVLPNRTLHATLECPLFIPPEGTLNIYLATPLWIRVEIGSKLIIMDEIPSVELNDTWWGKNTVEGELCYAANPPPSLRLDELPQDPTHVLSLMTFQNLSQDSVSIKELRLPLPFLSVFCDDNHHLWTEVVKMVLDKTGEFNLVITSLPPKELSNPKLLSNSRIDVKPSFKNFFNYLRGH